MNRMAKIWCMAVPRMIFVGGFEQVTEWHQANIGKIFGGDFHDPGCTWAKCGKKFSFDKTKISSKVIFFYLTVKMNRMAKIWCTVPRMIFVGGCEQPAVHSTGATAKKHFTRICQNQF